MAAEKKTKENVRNYQLKQKKNVRNHSNKEGEYDIYKYETISMKLLVLKYTSNIISTCTLDSFFLR